MAEMTPEIEPRRAATVRLAPPEYESRITDLAIEALADVTECDEASVCVQWIKDRVIPGKTLPVLYVYFADHVGDNAMPRVHVDALGELRPAHAILLVTMPSCTLIENGAKLRDIIRRGVEEFLLKYNVRKSPGVRMTLSR